MADRIDRIGMDLSNRLLIANQSSLFLPSPMIANHREPYFCLARMFLAPKVMNNSAKIHKLTSPLVAVGLNQTWVI